jgi:hypothetical protein
MSDLITMMSAAAGQVTGGEYQISRSLRFNSADSAYLSRTPASDTSSNKKGTFSGWVKVSANSGTNGGTFLGAADNYHYGQFLNQTFYFGNETSFINTAAVFRDFSAWYHVLFVFDTTLATDNDRMQIWVNGVRQAVGSFNTQPSLDSSFVFLNTAQAYYIGRRPLGNDFNGYMTEINFIDGQALTPSSFGETNETTGVWSPIRYAGSYGTNGFYLNFSDNTSTTTLGEDQAGSNDWTLNNLATSDSMLDTPSNNFAVMNPLSTTQPFTFREGNLRVYGSTSIDDAMVQATIGMRTGKWYWETLYTDSSNTGARAGISADNTYDAALYYVGETTKSYGINFVDGNKFNNASNSSYGSAFTQNSILMTAYDADNGKLWWGIDGIWYASGDPATGTNAAFTSIPENDYFPTISDSSLSNDADSFWLNFGQDSTFAGNKPIGIATDSSGVANFQYTPPSGFKALVTTNLPEPTVVQGNKYFNTVLYTGNTPSTNAITGVGFAPDWVWVKSITVAEPSNLVDRVRGDNLRLKSSTTDAESAATFALNSDGFTVGANSESNTGSMVAWNWKANGAGASNEDGTVAGTVTVSANTTAGISIVTWTNPASGTPTIGHGLVVAPSFIIVKDRTFAYNWDVGCDSIGWANRLNLNTTGATSSGFWNSTAPTASVFTYAASGGNSGDSMVAYCFAEVEGFSKFGSYTGNGLADGPFVYTGFRPAFLMVKRSSSGAGTANWVVLDTSRDIYNLAGQALMPNLPDVEYTPASSGYPMDILSNGFKQRGASVSQNESTSTYIYMAFAENPFKYSLAR